MMNKYIFSTILMNVDFLEKSLDCEALGRGKANMATINSFEKTTYQRVALLLITIGIFFAIDSYFKLSFVYKLWPLVLILLGFGLLGIFIKSRSSGNIYLGVGEYLLGFSGLALYCNFTSWTLMAKMWPLFIVFLGIVFISIFIWSKRRRIFLLLGLSILSLALLFFIIFSANNQFWWIIFLLIGFSILITGWAK